MSSTWRSSCRACRKNLRARAIGPAPIATSRSTSASRGGSARRPSATASCITPCATSSSRSGRHASSTTPMPAGSGKGTHAALDRCTHFARRYRYVLQADIVQFFPSVDHAILRDLLARRLADPPTLHLIDRIIDSGARCIHAEDLQMQWFPGDDLFAATRPRGLPDRQPDQPVLGQRLPERAGPVRQARRCAARPICAIATICCSSPPTSRRCTAGGARSTQFLVTLRLRIHADQTAVYPVAQRHPVPGLSRLSRSSAAGRANGVRFRRRLGALHRRATRPARCRAQRWTLRCWAGSRTPPTATPGGLRRQHLRRPCSSIRRLLRGRQHETIAHLYSKHMT